MAESTASKNERLNDYIADVTSVSLHSADPGTTGASELSGGSPAYARKAPIFGGAVGAAVELATPVVFDIAAGGAPAFYGLWKNSTFLAGAALVAAETPYADQGTYTLTSIPITA